MRIVIILDTCVLIYDALTPEKLSSVAKKALLQADKKGNLFCCDISLWEIAMLIQKKRLVVNTDIQAFLRLIIEARNIVVLGITPEIAELSVSYPDYSHYDPADRIIAATTLSNNASLITADKKLHKIKDLLTIW